MKDFMPGLRAVAAQAAADLPAMRPAGVADNSSSTLDGPVVPATFTSLPTSESLPPPQPQHVHSSGTGTVALAAPSARPPPPSDEDFKWAQDSYNATQRSIDTWVFFATFRTWQWSLDQKWTYVGELRGTGGHEICAVACHNVAALRCCCCC